MATGEGPRSVVRRVFSIVAAWAIVAASAVAAFARDEVPIAPGARLFGELRPGESVAVALSGLAGTRLDLSCAGYSGDDLEPGVSITDPDGDAVSVAGLVKTAKDRRSVAIRGLLLAKTGVYHVAVAAAAGRVRCSCAMSMPRAWRRIWRPRGASCGR
jgi:hypothetical protein